MAAQAVGSDYSVVKTWDQVTPFADKVVAYQTDSDYIGNGQREYNIGVVRFGLVRSNPSQWAVPYCPATDENSFGYNMDRVWKRGNVGSVCALTTRNLKPRTTMRLATAEEMGVLRTEITEGEAHCGCEWGDDRMLAILERSIPHEVSSAMERR